ncbi:hypothetical protein ABE522_02015 [Stenotrophomonas pennii]|uniref:hypothetical protein n=1 Tax=Stenotrophomonas lacuserhaii TaxID=2760084 RepID=UPI003209B803
MNISPIGWLHTLGSLPAIPLAVYMLVKHGRIVPGTSPGRAYFWFMLLGVLTVYPIAHQSVSTIIASVTLILLLFGYGIALGRPAKRLWTYLQCVALTITVFLLMVPTVSETMRRLPAEAPLATGLKDPLLLGVQGTLLLALIVGIPFQLRALVKRGGRHRRETLRC